MGHKTLRSRAVATESRWHAVCVMPIIMRDRPSLLSALELASALHGLGVPASPRRRRVLIADDDEEMRSMLVGELRCDGYDVVQARDGAEVATLLANGRERQVEAPDILVMDIRMPSRSGLELLADLRRLGSRVPVILITAFGDGEIHETARELGAIAVFDKPFDLDDLRTAILNYLPPARGS